MHSSFNWNQLLPLSEQLPETEPMRPLRASGMDVPLSAWEAEAIRRYRALHNSQGVIQKCAYTTTDTTHGAVLQLLLHLKLLPIRDWHACAQKLATSFRGPKAAPLSLLPYVVLSICTSHQLTPRSAVEWILDMSHTLLAPESAKVHISDIHWSVARELARSVYALQTALSSPVSSALLDTALAQVLHKVNSGHSQSGESHWGILPLCFLVRQHQDFALAEWSNDQERRRERIQKMCDMKGKLPLHVAVVLSAVA